MGFLNFAVCSPVFLSQSCLVVRLRFPERGLRAVYSVSAWMFSAVTDTSKAPGKKRDNKFKIQYVSEAAGRFFFGIPGGASQSGLDLEGIICPALRYLRLQVSIAANDLESVGICEWFAA